MMNGASCICRRGEFPSTSVVAVAVFPGTRCLLSGSKELSTRNQIFNEVTKLPCMTERNSADREKKRQAGQSHDNGSSGSVERSLRSVLFISGLGAAFHLHSQRLN
jgi:hypothetical protein